MQQYYALVNTASPETGMITVGEVLTEKQVLALGEEKIAELVREHVLRPLETSEPEPAPPKEEQPAQAEAVPDPAPEEALEEEDGLPELDTEGIVQDEPEEKTPPEPSKKGGRRKAE